MVLISADNGFHLRGEGTELDSMVYILLPGTNDEIVFQAANIPKRACSRKLFNRAKSI